MVTNAKYIHFYPAFQLPPALSCYKYKPFIKSVEFNLFCFKFWLNFLKWLFTSTHSDRPYIAWIGMKSCSKFLRSLVTTVYFTDRNWNSKAVYYLKNLSNYWRWLMTDDKIPQGIDIWLTLVYHQARKITLTKKKCLCLKNVYRKLWTNH